MTSIPTTQQNSSSACLSIIVTAAVEATAVQPAYTDQGAAASPLIFAQDEQHDVIVYPDDVIYYAADTPNNEVEDTYQSDSQKSDGSDTEEDVPLSNSQRKSARISNQPPRSWSEADVDVSSDDT